MSSSCQQSLKPDDCGGSRLLSFKARANWEMLTMAELPLPRSNCSPAIPMEIWPEPFKAVSVRSLKLALQERQAMDESADVGNLPARSACQGVCGSFMHTTEVRSMAARGPRTRLLFAALARVAADLARRSMILLKATHIAVPNGC